MEFLHIFYFLLDQHYVNTLKVSILLYFSSFLLHFTWRDTSHYFYHSNVVNMKNEELMLLIFISASGNLDNLYILGISFQLKKKIHQILV